MLERRKFLMLGAVVAALLVAVVVLFVAVFAGRKAAPQAAPDPRVAELAQRLDNVERGVGFMEYRLTGHDSAVSSHEERIGRLEKKH